VLFYRDFSRRLGSDQPFYAIRLHGIYGEEVPHNSIQDMARHYISEIELVQPEGPYLLCGFGVGGRIAFEMAQQLVSQRQEVRLLVLMDSAPPVTPKSDSQSSAGYYTRRLFQHIRNRQLLKTLMKRAKKPVSKVKDRFTLSPQERRMKSARDTLTRVSGAYMPQVYPGRIVYFTSAARDDGTFPDGWRELADGGLDIYEVPGDHIEILREPNVQVLVEQLRIYLDALATLKA
jgi:aspartate racemase